MMVSSSSTDARCSPPAGAPWDAPFGQATLAFLDLEMTGLRADRHRVVQICIERVVGDRTVGRLSSFVRPEPPAALGGQHIHGITPVQLAEAPTFSQLRGRACSLLDDAVLVAHGARHDVAFLRAELRRLGQPWDCPHYLDTVALSRRAFGFDSHSLAALVERLHIVHGRLHRADNDVAVLRVLLVRLVERLAPECPRTLWTLQQRRRVVRADVLLAAERAASTERPVTILYRGCSGPPRSLCFVVRKVRRDLDPPRVLGYLQLSRGRRELRADRILTIEQTGDEH